jgi:hypothetical protein
MHGRRPGEALGLIPAIDFLYCFRSNKFPHFPKRILNNSKHCLSISTPPVIRSTTNMRDLRDYEVYCVLRRDAV